MTIKVGASPADVVAAVPCSFVTVKQLTSGSNSFFVTDQLALTAPKQIPAGGSYTFKNASGWLAGVKVGTVYLADSNAAALDFSVESSGPFPASGGDAPVQVLSSSQAIGVRSRSTVIEAIAGAAGITLTLPSVFYASADLLVIMIDAGGGTVQVNPISGQTVNGSSAGYGLSNQWQFVQLERDQNDQNNWLVTAGN